jgi:hypothetical protein
MDGYLEVRAEGNWDEWLSAVEGGGKRGMDGYLHGSVEESVDRE